MKLYCIDWDECGYMQYYDAWSEEALPNECPNCNQLLLAFEKESLFRLLDNSSYEEEMEDFV